MIPSMSDDAIKLARTAPGGAVADSAPTTLKSYVVQRLREAILSGRYKPGDRLNESQLAREFELPPLRARQSSRFDEVST